MKSTIIIFTISLFTLQSQNESQIPKEGVYKWVSNFKSNYPNYDISFEIKQGENKLLDLFKGKSKIAHYLLEFESNKENKKENAFKEKRIRKQAKA